MKIKIYFPYYGYGNDDYETSDRYGSEEEYIEAIQKEDERNRDVVYESMVRQGNGQSIMGNCVKKFSVEDKEDEKIEFCTCEGVMYNENEDDMSVDEVVTLMARQEPFVMVLGLDFDTMEEDFIMELKLWQREHQAINSFIDDKGEAWCWSKEPRKDLEFEFENNANETKRGVCVGSVLMDTYDDNKIILYVERIDILN